MLLGLRRAVTTVAAIVVALILTCAPLRAAESLDMHDVLRLLRADVGEEVIQRQVESTGSRFPVSVEEILELREAGASDALISFLQDRTPETAAPSPAPPAASAENGIRVVHTRTAGGQEAIVLTNLDADGQRLLAAASGPLRGIISHSDRSLGGSGSETPVAPAAAEAPGVPARVEITVRQSDATEERLAALEEEVGTLARTPERPPVGADLPQHPINDFREFPIAAYPYGIPVLVPFAFEPQEFRVIRYGPFTSFTGALAAGVDPLRPPRPCSPGQACSVEQRLYGP
jgi:hypothetical protein